MNKNTDTMPVKIAALYRFCLLPHFETLRQPLAGLCQHNGIKGTLLLAHEGINGTVAGSADAIDVLVDWLASVPEFEGMEIKFSHAITMPFHRMKVRLKKEIVTMGVTGINPLEDAGAYVGPDEWNKLISDPDTVIVDTRNDYEVAIGTFEGAVNPNTTSFREFPEWVERNHNILADKKIAMFCTGGIRCEKATAYVRSLGLDNVYHLKGGILQYLEDVSEQDSLWNGECFVFDERVSVGHGLRIGQLELCRACRYPLTQDDKQSPHYVEGVSCGYCFDNKSEKAKARYSQRQRQVELATKRGQRHIGS